MVETNCDSRSSKRTWLRRCFALGILTLARCPRIQWPESIQYHGDSLPLRLRVVYIDYVLRAPCMLCKQRLQLT